MRWSFYLEVLRIYKGDRTNFIVVKLRKNSDVKEVDLGAALVSMVTVIHAGRRNAVFSSKP
jgi:hypothetical protein